jgi:hypothetical protein
MVISDKYKYVYFELAHTGTTAISNELVEHYDGIKVLQKHTNYYEFMRWATPEQKRYYQFSGIRNPLDEAVSVYNKFVSDHKGRFSNPNMAEEKGGNVTSKQAAKYRYIKSEKANFAEFFLRFYRYPYDNSSAIRHRKMNCIIRFESIQEDFSAVLKDLGLTPVREIPKINPTANKERNWMQAYDPAAVRHAMGIFGPFMNTWDYRFPEEWGPVTIPWQSMLLYRLLKPVRCFYWQQFRSYSRRKNVNNGTKQ